MEESESKEVTLKKLDLAWDITKAARLPNHELDTFLSSFRKVYHHPSETLEGKKEA